jgi:predicted dehydrogenase
MNESGIRIGIIGFGNIGKKRFEALSSITKFKKKIVYIVDKKKPTAALENIKHYFDWKKILKINVDLIIISTPTNVSEVIAGNLSGKFNLLIEKPLSTNIGKLKKIIFQSNYGKKLLKAGYNLRFDNGLIRAKKILLEKKIGKIYYCKITYANGSAITNKNKIGSLLDIGTHSLNLLQWIFPESKLKIISSCSQKNEFLKKIKTDNGFLMLNSKKIRILLHHGFCSWKNKFELEIVGSKGFIQVNSLPKWKTGQEVFLGMRTYPDGIPNIKKWIYKLDFSWKNELEYVLDIIKNKKRALLLFRKINNESYNTLSLIKNII